MDHKQTGMVIRSSIYYMVSFTQQSMVDKLQVNNLLDKSNRVKPDWNNPDYACRRECQSCFTWFDTTERWAKRCPKCKKANAPYKKKIINHSVVPF